MKTLLLTVIACFGLQAQLSTNPTSVAVPPPTSADVAAGRILGVSGWQNPPTGGGGGSGANNPCSEQPAPGALLVDLSSTKTVCIGIGLYTFATTIPAAGVSVTFRGAGPGSILQRSTSVDGFTPTGADFRIENLTYYGNHVGGGYAIYSTSDRFSCKDVQFTGFGSNGGRGLVRVAKAAGFNWDNCNFLDSPAEDNLVLAVDSGDIYGVHIRNSHFSNSAGTNGLAFRGMNFYLYNFEVSQITWSGVGRCLYFSARLRNGTVGPLQCELAGDTAGEVIGIWGGDGIQFNQIGGTDNNHGMSSQPFLAYHDCIHCTLDGYTAKLLNVGSQCGLALDTHDSILRNVHCYGGGGNLNNAAGRGMFEFGVGAPNSSVSGNIIDGMLLEMPVGATNIGFRGAIGLASGDTMDDSKYLGITVKGSGLGTGIQLATGAGASFKIPLIDDFHCVSLSTCINIGAGVTNAMVGLGQTRSVTTTLVNNGTGTIIK